MTTTPEEAVQEYGYDPGEWISEWIADAIKKPTLALPLGMVGPTGTGKSVFVLGILWNCAQQGDCIIMPGDAACEFRHFFNYLPHQELVSMHILIPQDFKYDFFIDKNNESADFIKVVESYGAKAIIYNPYEQSINDFIEPATILIVMDACFNLEGKTWFWQYNLKQVKFRKRYHYVEVTYCFHEASSYFPNTPFREQYKPVYLHSKDFVEFRKFLMRGIYLYHHSSMLFYLLEKQFETIIKKGSSYENRTPLDNHLGRGKRIDEYSVLQQGIEDVRLTLEGKFTEMKSMWKIIPDQEINFNNENFIEEEEQTLTERDKDIMLIQLWNEVKSTFPDGELDILIVEFWKLIFYYNIDAPLNKVQGITKKGKIFVEKCYYEALEDVQKTKDAQSVQTSHT